MVKEFLYLMFTRIILFIPLIWITYLYGGVVVVEIWLRILFCVFVLGLFSFLYKLLFENKEPDPLCFKYFHGKPDEPIPIKYNKYSIFRILNAGAAMNSGSDALRKIFSEENNRFLGLDGFILFIFLFIITGNPFIERYVGVVEEIDNVDVGEKKMFIKSIFESKDSAGDFNDFDSYRTQRFIFKETGYLKGFYLHNENPQRSFTEYLDVLKMSGIGIFSSFLEATIKSCIWVSFIYILFGLPYYLKIERDERR